MRSIPLYNGPGATQMAIDEYFATNATSLLRFYTWSKPCLSLGRYQPNKKAELEVVRRKSGGSAILHQHELAYTLIVPQAPYPLDVTACYRVLCMPLITALNRLGIKAAFRDAEKEVRTQYCFAGQSSNDIVVAGKKLIGSAQVHLGTCILQHGSILFSIDKDLWNTYGIDYTNICSIKELQLTTTSDLLATCIQQAYKQAWQIQFDEKTISDQEWEHIKKIEKEIYNNPTWTNS